MATQGSESTVPAEGDLEIAEQPPQQNKAMSGEAGESSEEAVDTTSEAASTSSEQALSNGSKTEDGTDGTEASDVHVWFLSTLGVMIFFYLGEVAFCYRLGQKKYEAHESSIWESMSKSVESQFGVWSFIIMAFLFSFMLGAVPDIANLVKAVLSETADDGTPSVASDITPEVVYTICTAILTVLITVEFTYLSNSPEQRVWQRMLVVALALDIVTLIVLSLFVFDPSFRSSGLGVVSLSIMALTTTSALLSSFLTVACVRELNLLDVQAMEDEVQQLRSNTELKGST